MFPYYVYYITNHSILQNVLHLGAPPPENARQSQIYIDGALTESNDPDLLFLLYKYNSLSVMAVSM